MGFDLSHRLVQRNTLRIITHFSGKIFNLHVHFFNVFISPFWKIACPDPAKSFILKSVGIFVAAVIFLLRDLFKVGMIERQSECVRASSRSEDAGVPDEIWWSRRCRISNWEANAREKNADLKKKKRMRRRGGWVGEGGVAWWCGERGGGSVLIENIDFGTIGRFCNG